MKIKNVYLDMDGVLADFEAGYEKKYKNLKDVSPEELHTQKKSFGDTGFYRDLPLMKDAKKLVKLVESYPVKVHVLTSVGSLTSKKNAVDKVLWLKKNFPQLVKNFNYTTSSKDKAKHANSDSLLIDDREKATNPFKSAGGSSILYKSFSKNRKEIEKILENDK